MAVVPEAPLEKLEGMHIADIFFKICIKLEHCKKNNVIIY